MELRNFLRDLRSERPELRYHLAYDRLYVEEECFVWSDAAQAVVRLEAGDQPGGDTRTKGEIFSLNRKIFLAGDNAGVRFPSCLAVTGTREVAGQTGM